MTLETLLAAGALAAGVLALPAAWMTVRSFRKASGNDGFRAHLQALRDDQITFTRRVLDASPKSARLPGFPMLAKPEWIPDTPFDLRDLKVEWHADPAAFGDVATVRSAAAKVLSKLKIGPITRYSIALKELAGLNALFDGVVYRLVAVDLTRQRKLMGFTKSSYFAYLDTCEVLAFEAQLSHAGRRKIDRRSTYRHRLGDPFDFQNRVASLGIDTLTVRRAGDQAGFFLHRRDPKLVVNNATLIGVIPAGEFTPSDVSGEAVTRDFDMWKNVMREYAEEMLGDNDAQGQGGRWIDYQSQSPYWELETARAAGKLQIMVVGLGVDPLVWKPELLTVCIIDAEVFDAVFPVLPTRNGEGTLLAGDGRTGLPFDADTVARYCSDGDVSPNTEALLQLAWRFRKELRLGCQSSVRTRA